jgi:NADH-ubiquinone oxidoreductase chain 3
MIMSLLFFFFIPFLSFVLLMINFILGPHNPYKEKDTPFECGIHSFIMQNRIQFTISFFIFGLLFLLFDLEILLVYPFTVSSYVNFIYGLIILLIFVLVLTLGFVFELGKEALKIDVKHLFLVPDKLLVGTSVNNSMLNLHEFISILRKKITEKFTIKSFLMWFSLALGLWLVRFSLLPYFTIENLGSFLCLSGIIASLSKLGAIFIEIFSPNYATMGGNINPKIESINKIKSINTLAMDDNSSKAPVESSAQSAKASTKRALDSDSSDEKGAKKSKITGPKLSPQVTPETNAQANTKPNSPKSEEVHVPKPHYGRIYTPGVCDEIPEIHECRPLETPDLGIDSNYIPGKDNENNKILFEIGRALGGFTLHPRPEWKTPPRNLAYYAMSSKQKKIILDFLLDKHKPLYDNLVSGWTGDSPPEWHKQRNSTLFRNLFFGQVTYR